MKKILFGIFILIGSCSGKKPPMNPIAEFQPAERLAELTNKNLKEVSGIASSINNPKLLWVINDKGNSAEVFLMDQNLDIKLTCKLEGVENRDWEDLAVGPGPDPTKQYLYIADIGDNDGKYKHKFIYRFEEPKVSENQSGQMTVTSLDKITFQLSDKIKDTESILINPRTKDLYVVSKRENPVYVYELKYPYSTDGVLNANKILSLPFTQIVAGSISTDGSEILMKNYKHIFYWKTSSKKSIGDILKEPAKEIPYEQEPQGESITWARDGSGFYTLSEKTPKNKSYLYFYKRK